MTVEVIPFLVLVAVFVGILLAAFGASRYHDPYQGSYPPYQPPYAPYPYPQYPYPQPPQLVFSLVMSFLTVIAVIFVLYVVLQYLKNTRSIDVVEYEQQGPDTEKHDPDIEGYDSNWGGIDEHPPQQGDSNETNTAPYEYYEQMAASIALYCQAAAFANTNAVYEAARQLAYRYPGRVFIGEKPDDLYPFKLLVGAYPSVQALKEVHGEGGYIRVPAEEGIDLYDPTQ